MGRRVTLESLDRIHYVLDTEQMELLGIGLNEIRCLRFPSGIYGNALDVYNAAVSRNIIPEILVDEGFYYRNRGIVPYRLTFAILRKWPRVSDFYIDFTNSLNEATGRKFYRYPSPCSYKYLLQGQLWWLRDIRVWVIIKSCKMAGIEVSQLFVPYRFRLSRKGEGVFNNLHSVVSVLDNVDIAALTGFGRLMATGEFDEKQVLEIVRWRNSKKASDGDN